MDALTTQLADAVRYTLTGYAASRGFTRVALFKLAEGLAAFCAAKNAPPVSGVQAAMSKFDELAYGKWEEMCEIARFGVMGQVLEAAKDAANDTLTAESMARSASRLEALWAKDAEIAELKGFREEVRAAFRKHGLAAGPQAVDGFVRERDAALKSAQLNLQPLHDLVAKCEEKGCVVFAYDLKEALAKLQTKKTPS